MYQKSMKTMKTRLTIIVLLLAALTASTAMARVPRKKPTALDKGMVAYDKQNYQEAIQWMDEALAANADNGIALAYKGASLLELERLNEADAALSRAAELIDDVNTTTRAWVHSNRFFALIGLGDTITAMQEIDKAIADDNRQASYYRNRGAIRSEQGDLEGAIADYDKSLELNPDNAQVRAMRDETAEYLKSYNQAVAQAGKVTITEREITADDGLVEPQFPGGMDALREYIYKKTGWNSSKVPVSVMVDVTVDRAGKVTKAVVSKGYNAKLDKKALDICHKLPKFEPATFNDEPVESTITIPVRFPKP